MQKKLLSMLALLCLTVAGAWAQTTPSVKELTVPESWSDDQTVFSAADLPGDFAEVSDEVAAAITIPAPTAEGTAYLIYGFNGTKAKMVVYQNGVIARGEGEVTRKEICEAAYPPISFKVYYTAAAETVALTPVTGQANQWTLAMPAGNVTLQVEYEPELAATLKALTAFTIEQGKATVAVADGTTDVTAQTTLADGKLSPLYAGQTITLTAQQGYKFRSVKAAAASAARTLAEATAEDVGKIVGADGNIYDTKADAEAVATGNAVAMIAYVGSETDNATYQHGLAIALSDEGEMNWSTAKSTCEGKTAVSGAAWLLPSQNQWKAMFKANGGNESSYSGLNSAYLSMSLLYVSVCINACMTSWPLMLPAIKMLPSSGQRLRYLSPMTSLPYILS